MIVVLALSLSLIVLACAGLIYRTGYAQGLEAGRNQ